MHWLRGVGSSDTTRSEREQHDSGAGHLKLHRANNPRGRRRVARRRRGARHRAGGCSAGYPQARAPADSDTQRSRYGRRRVRLFLVRQRPGPRRPRAVAARWYKNRPRLARSEDVAAKGYDQATTEAKVADALQRCDAWSQAHHLPLAGIYTGSWYWASELYMGNPQTSKSRDLWDAHYDYIPDALPGFQSYGGWNGCVIKQHMGSSAFCDVAGLTGLPRTGLRPGHTWRAAASRASGFSRPRSRVPRCQKITRPSLGLALLTRRPSPRTSRTSFIRSWPRSNS